MVSKIVWFLINLLCVAKYVSGILPNEADLLAKSSRQLYLTPLRTCLNAIYICLPPKVSLEKPKSVRLESAKDLENTIDSALQRIQAEKLCCTVGSLIEDPDWYGPRLLLLFPNVDRLSRHPGSGKVRALVLILKFATAACEDVMSTYFTVRHMQESSFWMDLDKLALHVLLRTSSDDWMMKKGRTPDALKDFEGLREKVWDMVAWNASSRTSQSKGRMNPIFMWTVDFLTEKKKAGFEVSY